VAFSRTSQALEVLLLDPGMGWETVDTSIVVCYIRCDHDMALSPYSGCSSTEFGKWT
jgi:hypothetical protein